METQGREMKKHITEVELQSLYKKYLNTVDDDEELLDYETWRERYLSYFNLEVI